MVITGFTLLLHKDSYSPSPHLLLTCTADTKTVIFVLE